MRCFKYFLNFLQKYRFDWRIAKKNISLRQIFLKQLLKIDNVKLK